MLHRRPEADVADFLGQPLDQAAQAARQAQEHRAARGLAWRPAGPAPGCVSGAAPSAMGRAVAARLRASARPALMPPTRGSTRRSTTWRPMRRPTTAATDGSSP